MLRLITVSALLGSLSSYAAPANTERATTSCSCGYVLSKYGNEYYPLAHTIDFTTAADRNFTSATALSAYGLGITDNQGVGGSYQDVQPVGTYKNLRIKNGALELIVPGGQKLSTGLSAAEITFGSQYGGMTGGVFTVEALIDGTPGTCQAVFTYHDPSAGDVQDELDIEVLSSYISKAGSNGTPPGIELTNFDPTDPANVRNDYTIVPFPSNPTTAYHNYTIDWANGKRKTWFDSTSLKSPSKYGTVIQSEPVEPTDPLVAVNPSNLYINHWTDGDPEFTQGPPTTTAIMRVRRAQFYYKTVASPGLPSGCTQAKACTV